MPTRGLYQDLSGSDFMDERRACHGSEFFSTEYRL